MVLREASAELGHTDAFLALECEPDTCTSGECTRQTQADLRWGSYLAKLTFIAQHCFPLHFWY